MIIPVRRNRKTKADRNYFLINKEKSAIAQIQEKRILTQGNQPGDWVVNRI
jgi:hypothetical protein